MKRIVIFGLLDTAELAHFYIENDTPDSAVAFTVHEKFINGVKSFQGLPVVPFEKIEQLFPPDEYMFFAPMTGQNMNRLRESVYLEAKSKGYDCYSYISSKATVWSSDIGENCFILEDNTIQPFTKIGNNVVLWSGNHIGHHSTINDHAFFTSHVVLSGHCKVGRYTWFGVNATIRNDCSIGQGSLIAMGTCVTKDVPEWTIVKGVPGKECGDSREINF